MKIDNQIKKTIKEMFAYLDSIGYDRQTLAKRLKCQKATLYTFSHKGVTTKYLSTIEKLTNGKFGRHNLLPTLEFEEEEEIFAPIESLNSEFEEIPQLNDTAEPNPEGDAFVENYMDDRIRDLHQALKAAIGLCKLRQTNSITNIEENVLLILLNKSVLCNEKYVLFEELLPISKLTGHQLYMSLRNLHEYHDLIHVQDCGIRLMIENLTKAFES